MRLNRYVPAAILLLSPGLAATLDLDPRDASAKTRYLQTHSTDLQQLADDSCENIVDVVQTIGTSKAVVVYCSFGGLLTLYVCQRNDGLFCSSLALAVAAGFMSLFAALHQLGAVQVFTRDGQNQTMSALEFWHQHLAGEGVDFQAITDSTEALLPLYGGSQRKPLSVTSLHGVKHFDDDETAVNMDVYDFGNGEGHIHLPHDMLVDRKEDTDIHARLAHHDDLNRRLAKAPGFKLSYTTRLKTELSRTHQADMSQSLSNVWAELADGGSGMHDFIGFVETGHDANFYYRLIPETVDFGLNYETVDSCGQMGQYLDVP